MNILRPLQLWFLYFFLWGSLLITVFGPPDPRTYLAEALFGLAVIIAIFHTAFKMKYGGFRGLFGLDRGLIGHLSRVKNDREEKEKEIVRLQMERMRESEDAARRFRSWLENGVLLGVFFVFGVVLVVFFGGHNVVDGIGDETGDISTGRGFESQRDIPRYERSEQKY